ncbi:MAG TPA: S8 family serine peptidase [Actinomycetota bacterium]|nr:S8 family serine peptidase [Actinomycetota bacterium]
MVALTLPIALASPLGASPRAAGPARSATTAPPARPRLAYVPHEVLVRFRGSEPAVSRPAAVARAVPFARIRPVRGTGLSAVALPYGTSVPDAVTALARMPGVRAVQPDYRYSFTLEPTDPDFVQQWGLQNTGQPHMRTNGGGTTSGLAGADAHLTTAWNTTEGSPSTVIAVLDTGVELDHPDLAGNIWTNAGETANGTDDDHDGYIDDLHGWDFVDHDDDPSPMFDGFDWDIHGTHVAGIIAAARDGSGTVGVCPTCTIMPLRVGTDAGGVDDEAVIAAIHFAVRHHAGVMNMSFGGPGWSGMLRSAIAAAGRAGVLTVAAAGNAGADDDSLFVSGAGVTAKLHSPEFPAAFDLPTIISVAASDDHDRIAGFSNVGRVSVDLAAPGVDILSTIPSMSYGMLDGTSMATPFVVGVAGLVASLHPGYSPVQIKDAILHGVDRPHGVAGGRTVTNGRLDAAKALNASTANATPKSDGTIAGAVRLVHAKTGTLSYPADVNDVFRVHLLKGHRYVATLDVPKDRNFDLWVWKPGTLDVWQVEPGCTKATCHVLAAGAEPKGKDETVRFAAGKTGTYYLIVTDRGGAGRYRLTLQPR